MRTTHIGRAARPYVDALFAVVADPAPVEALLPALDSFADAMETGEELPAVLGNPGVPRAQKRAIVGDIAHQVGTGVYGTRFLLALLGHGRLLNLREVLAAIRKRLDEERNLVEATLQTAVALDVPEVEAIRAALERRTGHAVRLRAVIEPDLLGGFLVKVGSEVFDATLARRLERAKTALHGAAQVG